MASTVVGAGIDKKQNKINSVSNSCFHGVCSTQREDKHKSSIWFVRWWKMKIKQKEGIENAKSEGIHLVLNKGTRIGLPE